MSNHTESDNRGISKGEPNQRERGLGNFDNKSKRNNRRKPENKTKNATTGWLNGVIIKPSPVVGVRRNIPLIGTVIHATKGPPVINLINNLHESTSSTSWHFTISRDGIIFQHVSILNSANHAGKSSIFLKDRFRGGKFLNMGTIGIELGNWLAVVKEGKIYKPYNHQEEKIITNRSAIGIRETIPYGQGLIKKTGKTVNLYWETYPIKQINGLKYVLEEIAKMGYVHALELLGHEIISPKRKIDPGPVFPFDEINEWAYQKYILYSKPNSL